MAFKVFDNMFHHVELRHVMNLGEKFANFHWAAMTGGGF